MPVADDADPRSKVHLDVAGIVLNTCAERPRKHHLHSLLPYPHALSSQLELALNDRLVAELLGNQLSLLFADFLLEKTSEYRREHDGKERRGDRSENELSADVPTMYIHAAKNTSPAPTPA